MQSAVAVGVGVFALFCVHRVDSGNLTTELTTDDQLQKNNSAVGVQLKLIKHKPLISEKEAPPPTGAAAEEASEGRSTVHGKWESGNDIVMAVITALLFFVICLSGFVLLKRVGWAIATVREMKLDYPNVELPSQNNAIRPVVGRFLARNVTINIQCAVCPTDKMTMHRTDLKW